MWYPPLSLATLSLEIIPGLRHAPAVTFTPGGAREHGVTVQGTVRSGEKFESYLGIPFAEPRQSY